MVLKGVCASPGRALGKIYRYEAPALAAPERYCAAGEEAAQLERFEAVKQKAAGELEAIRKGILLRGDLSPAQIRMLTDIFLAHTDIINDAAINEEVPELIRTLRWTGDRALYTVYNKFLGMIKKVRDPLIAERWADFEDVCQRLLRIWYGLDTVRPAPPEPSVIAARDILPSEAAVLDPAAALGVITEYGGPASHTAMILSACGIPAVTGAAGLMAAVRDGQLAAVDAVRGAIIPDPGEETIREYGGKP